MNRTWQALAREAELSAEHIAIGATAIGRVNSGQTAHYAQAFFALSAGFERSCKLALVLEHALENDGAFPASKALKDYGHDLRELLARVDAIAGRRCGASEPAGRLPQAKVHRAIIDTLADFAMNLTRYFNLDLVTGDPKAAGREDPIAAWSRLVTSQVLTEHYKPRFRQKHAERAREVDALFTGAMRVHFHAETGELVDTVYEGAREGAMSDFARPWERMYVLQIARFLGGVLSKLGYLAQAQRLEDIPYFSEFFAIFNNEDVYLRQRKTWTIH